MSTLRHITTGVDRTAREGAACLHKHPMALACMLGTLLTITAPVAAQTVGGQGGRGGANEQLNGGASGNGGGASFTDGASSSQGNGGAGTSISGAASGGGGGSVGATVSTSGTASSDITGGNGGAGSAAGSYGSGGGGGGAGAYFSGSGFTFTVNGGVTVKGGNGNAGGPGSSWAGGGGGGGNGIMGSAVSIVNGGTITGGNGGKGGAGNVGGGGGGGGNGVAGSNLTITNSGTISGGTGGVGGSGIVGGGNGTNGDAVLFSGGANALTMNAGSVLNGAVEVTSGATATITLGTGGLDLSGGTLGNSALIVNGATTIQTNGNTFAVSGNISGNAALSLTGGGQLTLGTVKAGSLADDASTTFNGNVTTSGGQSYTNAAVLNSDVTFSDTAGGSISFGSTVDGAHNLTVSTAGAITFGSGVGGNQTLGSLTTGGGGITVLNGDVSTTLNQTYNELVTLQRSVMLSAGTGGLITLKNGVSGTTDTLVIDGSAVLAGTSDLNMLGARSAATLQGGVTTHAGGQTYSGPVTLNSNTVLNDTAGGDIAFDASVNGQYNLNLATPSGGVIFQDGAGNLAAIKSLSASSSTFNSVGALNIGSGGLYIATTAGAIAQNAAWSVAGPASFSAGDYAIALNSGNAFTGVVSLNNSGANDVAVTNGMALKLGNIAVGSGRLDLSGIGISQMAGSSIAQDTGANAASFQGNAGAISLDNTGNAFTGTVSLSNSGNNNVSLRNDLALQLGAVAVGSGTLTVSGAGISQAAGTSITQATAAGTATFAGGSGDVTLGNANNTFTGAVDLSGGNVTIAAAGPLTLDAVMATGDLQANASGALEITGNASAANATLSAGGNTLVTGNLDTTGSITIAAGALQVGNGGTTGSLGGDVVDNTALTFNRSDASSYNGALSGTGLLTQSGAGTLTLDGRSGGFAGATTVSAGTLIIGSTAGNGAALGGDVAVNAGATLGGNGTIGGDVHVFSGAALSPGNATGTLTVNGNLTAAQGSVMNYQFGAPGANFQVNGAGSSLNVGGNLELDGVTLNLADAGGMGPGLYKLFTYGGSLTENNGGLALGALPAGQAFFLQNLTAQKQINLVDSTGYTLSMWNANGQASSTQLGGGSGTWSTTSPTWTDMTGAVPNSPMSPQPGFAVFGGAPGTVTVDSAGNVSATGMQFASDGYVLTGGALSLVGSNGAAPVIRVGDGSSAGAAMTATIENVIAGSDGLVKADLGTLVLAGNNTYTGGTVINGGTLSVSSNTNLGAPSGGIALDGGVLKVTGNAFVSTARSITLGSAGGGFDIADAANTFTVGQSLGGAGALTVAGAGTLVLTGANTYTGGTAIKAGTLQIGDGGTAGWITGNVDNNGTLIFNRADAVSFDGTIAGNGAVMKQSGGTLILTGDNSYTGGTAINAGTLQIGNGGTSGSIAGNVDDNGALVFDRGDTVTFAGAISGGGSLTQQGAGTLVLTGANNYAGGTTIRAGALQIGNGGTTGAITGNVASNGALVFDRKDAVIFAGTVAGSGSLTQQGAGTLTLTGANTYSGRTVINGGTLALSGSGSIASSSGVTDNGTLDIGATANGASIASLDGGGAVNLGSRTLTLTNASGAFAGVISGSGGLTLQSGSETLTGSNTFTGATTISGDGALTLGNGGALAGNVVDNGTLAFSSDSASTFAGSISGNGAVVQNGSGILVLNGNSASFKGNTQVQSGTLEVGDASTPSAVLGGNVAVASGGTLRGHGTIGGNVTNNGTVWAGGSIGTLTVQGNYAQTAQGVLKVDATADGQASLLAVNGSADLAGSALVVSDSGNWAPRTSYTILTANGGVNGQFASTRSNFAFLAPMLSYTADGVNLALERNLASFASVAQTPNQAAVANAIDPTGFDNPVYNAVVTLNAQAARAAFDQLSGEIHASTRTAIMDDEHALRDAVTNHLLGYNGDAGGQEGRTANGTSVWTAAWTRDGDEDGNGNASTLTANGGGMLLGLDVPVSDAVRLGGVIGLGSLSTRISPLNSSAHAQTRHVGVYGSLQKDGLRLIGGAFYGWQDMATHRDIAVAGLAGSAEGKYDVNTLQGYLDGSYMVPVGRGALGPFVNVATQRLHTDAFTETGTVAALSAGAQDTTQTYGTLGLRGSLQLDARGAIQAHASVGWQHAWGALGSATTLRLASGSPEFTVDGVPVARDAAAVTVGLRLFSGAHLSADASYSGQFANHATGQSARLSLSYVF